MNDSVISFLLNGNRMDIDIVKENISPTTTVLNYLRGLHDYKGTKEGCAEGDCGACTVVIAEVQEHGKPVYKACDSCLIFLPMLHGKELVTVEGLKNNSDLHPAQHAMIDSDGSQCGYCTPGITMSLFAMYENNKSAKEVDPMDALTGNLCRCTGYRPIVEAANTLLQENPVNNASSELPSVSGLLELREGIAPLSLNFDDQEYYQPQSLRGLFDIKRENPEALLVNGATDVGLLVTKQRRKLPLIIDISAVSELKNIEEYADHVEYGAGASLEAVKRHCQDFFPALYAMLEVFGSRQIRELATLGGNIANASPIGDTPPVLMAYDASVNLRSSTGQRVLKLTDFITGYRTTDLKETEIISSISIPKCPDTTRVVSYKISKRKDLDISTVSAGFRLTLDDQNKVCDIRLYYGGMAAMVMRAKKAEGSLFGKPWTRKHVEEAQLVIKEDFNPISDARAEAKGRDVMAKNLLMKFWLEVYDV